MSRFYACLIPPGPPNSNVRGFRHTMLEDSDISSTRHARAAVGGLIAGLAGTGVVYVSGSAEHQGRPAADRLQRSRACSNDADLSARRNPAPRAGSVDSRGPLLKM